MKNLEIKYENGKLTHLIFDGFELNPGGLTAVSLTHKAGEKPELTLTATPLVEQKKTVEVGDGCVFIKSALIETGPITSSYVTAAQEDLQSTVERLVADALDKQLNPGGCIWCALHKG